MSNKRQKQEIEKWKLEKPKLDAERQARGIYFVPDSEVDEFNDILQNAMKEHSLPQAPVMPNIFQIYWIVFDDFYAPL